MLFCECAGAWLLQDAPGSAGYDPFLKNIV